MIFSAFLTLLLPSLTPANIQSFSLLEPFHHFFAGTKTCKLVVKIYFSFLLLHCALTQRHNLCISHDSLTVSRIRFITYRSSHIPSLEHYNKPFCSLSVRVSCSKMTSLFFKFALSACLTMAKLH
ncbi:hypothetical protein V8E52_009635 [Russula decolorans]